jgi:hypothetical protein
MRVAIVGAGTLGSVYGARLAGRSDSGPVDVVARSPTPERTVLLERVDGGERLEWAAPARIDSVPPAADVILVCVRYEQLDAMVPSVAASRAPVVVMTPMMPVDQARLSAALPGRLVAGRPGVVAYENDARTIRYWLPRDAPTLIEARSPAGAEAELAVRLEGAGIAATVESDVLMRNAATTVSLLPFVMAVSAAGGIDAALADDGLVALGLDAAHEARVLAGALGKPEAWSSMLPRFVRPFMLKAAVGVARSRFPDSVNYVEHHFRRKLLAQNILLGERMVELAKAKGTPHGALQRLHARLIARGRGAGLGGD